MSLLSYLRYLLGYPVCQYCGSENIINRGFPGMNARVECRNCGRVTVE